MYTIPDEIKRSYEKLKVPLLIIGPLASGGYRPLAISDGFLDFNNISRDELYNYYGDKINDGLYEKVHPDEREKLRAISIDFLAKKSEYDVTFRVRRDDGYHLVHAAGYWQTVEDGTDLAFLVYADVQRHEELLSEISDKYKLFQRDDFYTDVLTNLPNINYINKHGDAKMKEIVQRGETPVVLYLDVDSMQSYNRRYGLEKGDELLILVANVLMAEFTHGIVARFASDFFEVIDEYNSQEELVSSC